jgi:HAD superfamily hydrolase (TIGR01509 family)
MLWQPAMAQPIRGLLLDFDGTLVDLRCDWTGLRHELSALLSSHGVSPLPPIERLLTAAPPVRAAVLARIAAFESRAVPESPVLDGAAALLERVVHAGARFAIVTRNCKDTVVQAFERHRLPAPAVIIALDDDARPKPHPEAAERALTALGLAAEECILVGDSRYDLELGRAAGLYRVLVANPRLPPVPRDEAERAIDSLDELADLSLAG